MKTKRATNNTIIIYSFRKTFLIIQKIFCIHDNDENIPFFK